MFTRQVISLLIVSKLLKRLIDLALSMVYGEEQIIKCIFNCWGSIDFTDKVLCEIVIHSKCMDLAELYVLDVVLWIKTCGTCFTTDILQVCI